MKNVKTKERRINNTLMGHVKKIKVYTASVDCLKDPALYQKTLDLLPSLRRSSADRMKVESGKRLSAGAGLLLMAALADYMESDCRSFASFHTLQFELGPQGKPSLTDYPEVRFNLSHSGNRVLCIVGPTEVGCDVEVINPAHTKTIIRCFAESEQILAAQSAENFFRLWTLKESILKLSGKGFTIPFNSFEVSLSPLSVRQEIFPDPVILKEYDVTSLEETDYSSARKGLEETDYSSARKGLEETDCSSARKDLEETDCSSARKHAGDGYCVSCAAIGAELPKRMIGIDFEQLLGDWTV